MEQSELRVDVIDLTRLAQIKVLTKVNLTCVQNMATLCPLLTLIGSHKLIHAVYHCFLQYEAARSNAILFGWRCAMWA